MDIVARLRKNAEDQDEEIADLMRDAADYIEERDRSDLIRVQQVGVCLQEAVWAISDMEAAVKSAKDALS